MNYNLPETFSWGITDLILNQKKISDLIKCNSILSMNKTHNINEKTQLPHQIQTQQGKEKNLKQVSFIRKWSGSQMTGTMYSMHLTEVQTSLTTSNNVTLAERKVPFIQSN